MSIAQFFQNLLNLFVSIQIPAGTVALVGGGLQLLQVHLLAYVVRDPRRFLVVFAAANIVSTLYGG